MKFTAPDEFRLRLLLLPQPQPIVIVVIVIVRVVLVMVVIVIVRVSEPACFEAAPALGIFAAPGKREHNFGIFEN